MIAIYRIFLKGLLTILPFTITIYLLIWIATRAEQAFSEPLKTWLPRPLYFPGAGLLLTTVLIFLVGLIVNNYLAARLWAWIEETLLKVPFIKTIYNPLRDVMNLFSHDSNQPSKRVVLVDLDTISILGLITRDAFEEFAPGTIPEKHAAVFIPYSYAIGGFTVLVPRSRLREINMAPERAMQLAITAWIKSDKRAKKQGLA